MSVTNINTAKIQREIDQCQLAAIDGQIQQMEDLMVYLLHQRKELHKRLGVNEPTDPEVA